MIGSRHRYESHLENKQVESAKRSTQCTDSFYQQSILHLLENMSKGLSGMLVLTPPHPANGALHVWKVAFGGTANEVTPCFPCFDL